MPFFGYRAKSWQGGYKEGIIEAKDRRQAVKNLQGQELVVVSIIEKSAAFAVHPVEKKTSSILRRLQEPVNIPFTRWRSGRKEMRDLSYKLAAVFNAGIPLLEGIYLLAGEAEHPYLKKKLEKVAAMIEKGQPLAHAFRSQGGYFPSFFINMVEAGEAGGVLDRVTERLAVHFEKQHDLELKIKAATAYPKFVAAVILIVTLFLLVVVLPSFAGIFESMKVEMPFLTRSLIAVGEFTSRFWPGLILLTGGLYVVFRIITGTERGIKFLDRVKLALPLGGVVYRKVLYARFCRTLSTMLDCGAGILAALSWTSKIVENKIFQEKIEKAGNDVARGRAIAEAFAESGLFPPMFLGMVNVGEKTGRLVEMLEKAAVFFEAEVDYVMGRLEAILEPFLIIALALVVGIIVLSILLPLFDVFNMAG